MSELFWVNFLNAESTIVVVKIFPDFDHQFLVDFDISSLPAKAVFVLAVLVHIVHLARHVVAQPTLEQIENNFNWRLISFINNK